NRPAPDKSHGRVVDYYGVGRHLKMALAAYSADDVQGVLTNFLDELPTLADRHRRALAIFQEHGVANIEDQDACAALLRDPKLRASTQELQQGQPAEIPGIDPRSQAPFLRLLMDETSPDVRPADDRLAALMGWTVEIVEHIRQEIRVVDFWRNTHAQNVLRGWV